jgi:hypothetical protein
MFYSEYNIIIILLSCDNVSVQLFVYSNLTSTENLLQCSEEHVSKTTILVLQDLKFNI